MKEILLTQEKVALVDNDDYSKLEPTLWQANKYRNTFYAVSGHGKIYMHRVIMNPPDGYQIDHIDGNGLNNQKSNLRIVSVRENGQNIHVNKTSKHPGVYWKKHDKRWAAAIVIHGKKKWIGNYKSEELAAAAYMNFANVVEYSRKNIVKECCV